MPLKSLADCSKFLEEEMKTSKFIISLSKSIAKHGDVEVKAVLSFSNDYDFTTPEIEWDEDSKCIRIVGDEYTSSLKEHKKDILRAINHLA